MTPTKQAVDELKKRVLGNHRIVDYKGDVSQREFSQFIDGLRLRLDEVFEDAEVAYMNEHDERGWRLNDNGKETHSALLIDIKPIEKPPTKAEIVDFLRSAILIRAPNEGDELADRIERLGVSDG